MTIKYFIVTKLFYENLLNVIYVQFVNIPIKL